MLSQSPEPMPTLPEVPAPRDIRALLLDDSSFDRARIRRLSDRMELPITLDEVGSIEELDSAVDSADYDLILIDYRLPVGDGMVALDHILQNPRNRSAGKIMITGNEAVDTAVEAMRAGCHDFLSKDRISTEVLRSAILNALTVAQSRQVPVLDLDAQREMIRQGVVDAFHDSEVQGSVVSLFSRHFAGQGAAGLVAGPDVELLNGLLRDISDPDDFVFH